MSWPIVIEMLPYIAAVGAIISGILFVMASSKINSVKLQQANIEKEIAQANLKMVHDEHENKINIFGETKKITEDISRGISKNLIDDPTWLDRFMDQTGVTYSASVYGDRIGHFYYEKQFIAEQAINEIEKYINQSKDKICLLIDSGTTMYPVFQEITKRIHSNKDLWKKQVCIVTNNLPGIHYLMKYGKEDLSDNYSEILLDCFLIPGKPLSVYAAITGTEAEKWLKQIRLFLKDWNDSESSIKIISFLTGNYMTRSDRNNKVRYSPAARGEGHVEMKNEMVKVSDEVFVLSSLTKFSFATCDILNDVNGFTIQRSDKIDALKHPRQVKYVEILIPDEKPYKIFSTKRVKGNLFEHFSSALYLELIRTLALENVFMPEIDIKKWIPNVEIMPHLEIEREIPHKTLRDSYAPDNDIWHLEWILKKGRKV